MGYIIIGVVVGIGVAFACMMFFCRGIKVGMAVERQEEPESVFPKKEAAETTGEMPEQLQSMIEKINNYDPYKEAK